ncbi:hypothetical protein GSI_09246 [Ganoderma sinense ZZ0214-1]|uniref:DUF6533 domain-containing protein n=1 Tax=Ganoderma sinense ZZ0214-1 TaxID=1077348 RepID=A0A2G8S631_9APHY|nr:hypothetical protein GSI_09246 [Ganoderma sinense ZZ0214-1]
MSLLGLLPKGVSIIQAEQLFIQAIEDTFVVNLSAAAAATWVAYDITLTFGDEVTFIWRAKWTMQKVMYFLVRYYGLFALLFYLSGEEDRLLVTQPLLTRVSKTLVNNMRPIRYVVDGHITKPSFPCVLFGEAMFLFRLYAVYERNKRLLGLIVFFYIAGIVTAIVTGILEGRLIHILPRPDHWPMPGCFTLASVPLTISLGAWVLNLVTPTIYMMLMIYKLMTGPTFRSDAFARRDPIGELSELRRFSPLIYLLLRDGIFYFVMVFLVNLANLILFVRFNGRALEGVGVAWLMAVYSVASSRLCLNLRSFAVRPPTQDEDSESDPSSDPKAIMLSTVVDLTGTASYSFGSSRQTQSTYTSWAK